MVIPFEEYINQINGQSLTEIICIIDKSGSMWSVKEDTIGGFNTFLEEQQKLEGEAVMTTVLFDTNYSLLYSGKSIKEVEPLNTNTYVPNGGTALLDAIGKTINDIQDRTKDSLVKPNVIMVILTDGQENASKEYNRSVIKEKITECQNNGWEILYLGANQDSFSEAGSYGISSINTVNYTAKNTKSAFRGISVATCSYRDSGVVLDGWKDEVK